MARLAKITGHEIKEVLADKGYRGHGIKDKTREHQVLCVFEVGFPHFRTVFLVDFFFF